MELDLSAALCHYSHSFVGSHLTYIQHLTDRKRFVLENSASNRIGIQTFEFESDGIVGSKIRPDRTRNRLDRRSNAHQIQFFSRSTYVTLRGFARDEFELFYDPRDGHLEVEQSQTHAGTHPRAESERYVNGRVAIDLVFGAEST